MTTTPSNLVGSFLIAMPGLADPNFWQSVVLLGVHSLEDGAFGLVINRTVDVSLNEILTELGEEPAGDDLPEVLAGGPVQPSHGFVLFEHGGQTVADDDISIANELVVSGNTTTLSRLAHEAGDLRFSLLLGYAGWYPGQLEQEIEENSWVIAPLDTSIIFEVPAEDRWSTALRSIGIDPGTLVDAGSAEPS
ncbi:MAG: YqgE/AlgH family protein [Holophagae bacterium]|jgi:putative transcriptional regulator